MKWLSIFFVFALGPTLYAQEKNKAKESVGSRLIVEQETAFDFEMDDLQKMEWIIDPEISWKPTKKLKLFGQIRLYNETMDHLEPGRSDFSGYSDLSKPLRINNRSYLELRELYADFSIGSSFWRLGKQQVVWGETDGFKILDVLNPMTFREFIFDDFDDSRIPTWSIKGDINLGPLKIEPYWSPDKTSHQIPIGGLYQPDFPMGNIPQGISIDNRPLRLPSRFVKDSDFGTQVSISPKGWDISLNYIYQFDKLPVFERSFDTNLSTLTIIPKLKRQHIIGGSVGKTVGQFGLRTELAFFPNKNFTTTNMNDADGIYTSNHFMSGIAIDFFGISDGILTFQWFGDMVEESAVDDFLTRDQVVNTSTLMLTKYFLNQRIKIEAFGGYRFSEKGGILDINISYLLRDNLNIWVGGSLISAESNGLINPYRKRDRMLVGLEWGLQSNN